MKPFRGKPEKPERSKGEIHSRFVVGVRRSSDGKRSRFSHLLFFDLATNACTFLLVGRRDPLGVGLRRAVEPGCKISVFTSGPACPGRLARRYTKGSRPLLERSTRRKHVRCCRYSDLVPVLTSGDCWRRSSRTDLLEPICDAIALGTFRTRLETRTKESSMCASHWELLNLKA